MVVGGVMLWSVCVCVGYVLCLFVLCCGVVHVYGVCCFFFSYFVFLKGYRCFCCSFCGLGFVRWIIYVCVCVCVCIYMCVYIYVYSHLFAFVIYIFIYHLHRCALLEKECLCRRV